MLYSSAQDLVDSLQGVVELKDGSAVVVDPKALQGATMDRLAYNAVFHTDGPIRGACRALIQSMGVATGLVPASIQGLYEAMGRGEVSGFTVPAINIRGMTYDSARAVFRAATRHGAGAVIFEIARSEIGYTEQRPAEYATAVMAAGIREGFQGPLFLQGDHFQLNAKKYAADPEGETEAVRSLAREGVEAGFYNIDIDASTLVDLSRPAVREQQRVNAERTAEITAHIRGLEPEGVTVSVGGEIGEVGGKNSTVEELEAFMEEYREALGRMGASLAGMSKISVQTGTTHGGVVLPDGSVAKVKLDFDTLGTLSRVARERYGLCGAVQHGASTLPDEAFDRFPEVGAAEIHLATGFQNMIYDHPIFPSDLREEIYAHLREACANERKEGQTEEQFYYKTRKKGFGPFKAHFWNLDPEIREVIGQALEAKFSFLFGKLRVGGTAEVVAKTVKPVFQAQPIPEGILQAG